MNPVSQKGLLKYAMNKDKADNVKYDKDSSDSDNDQDFSKFGNKKNLKADKAQREKELAELKAQGKDKIDESGAIRLPNRVQKGIQIDPRTGTAKA